MSVEALRTSLSDRYRFERELGQGGVDPQVTGLKK